ncbi:hypothetical protein C1882_11195 [Pseudomonas sp. FW305-E2]|nr:hypothetical protein C1882_11195 [Pseudomonas sp. FW305-E2]
MATAGKWPSTGKARRLTSSNSLCRPIRGLARSRRNTTAFESCARPVGAGKPAKNPPPISTRTTIRQPPCVPPAP